MRISTELSKQRGTSALETSLAVVPVLLVCMVGLELVHAHQSKQLVSLALQEAGRRASVTAADQHQVERAFALALSPLFTPAGQHANPLARQKTTIERYQRLYALPLWQLELTESDVSGEKSHEYRAVQLDLLYLHEPLQSWLRKVLQRSAGWLSASPNGLAAKAQQQGLVAMKLSRRAVIHSNGVQQRPKLLLKDTLQQPQQGLNELQAPNTQQGLHQRQPLVQGLRPAPTAQEVRSRIPLSQPSDSEGKTLQPATLAQTRSDSKPKIPLDSVAERAGPPEASAPASLRQESEKEDLCGVLLCCLP